MSETGPYKRDGETVEVPGEEDRHEIADVEDDKPKYQQKEWLYRQYHIFGKNQREIAKLVDVSSVTIGNWMEKYDIPTRDMNISVSMAMGGGADERLLDEGWLEEQYEECSLKEIAEELEVSPTTVRRQFNRLNIDTRSLSEANQKAKEKQYGDEKYNDKEWLYKQYWGKGKSQRQIAEENGWSKPPVREALRKFGIQIRSSSTGLLQYYKKVKCENKSGGGSGSNSGGPVERTDDGGVALNYAWKSEHETEDGCILNYRDPSWLQRQMDKGLTIKEISDGCSGTYESIRYWIERHGLQYPENHKKLTGAEVKKIREAYRSGEGTNRGLADEYDVSHSHISKVVRGETWPDAPGPIKGEDYD